MRNRPGAHGGPLSAAAGFSALIYGFAHLLDFRGTLARSRGRFSEGLEGDAKAVRGDWRAAITRTVKITDEQAA
jgi:hypothetical protein